MKKYTKFHITVTTDKALCGRTVDNYKQVSHAVIVFDYCKTCKKIFAKDRKNIYKAIMGNDPPI